MNVEKSNLVYILMWLQENKKSLLLGKGIRNGSRDTSRKKGKVKNNSNFFFSNLKRLIYLKEDANLYTYKHPLKKHTYYENPFLSSTREQPQDWEYYQSGSSPSFHLPRNQEDPRCEGPPESLQVEQSFHHPWLHHRSQFP